MVKKQLECRIVINYYGSVFSLGMFDPVAGRYEPLGKHPMEKIDKVVRDLKVRMEKEGHKVSFSEKQGQ